MPVAIVGVDELHRRLNTLQNQLESAASEIISSGAAAIEREIASREPEKTGQLQANLVTKVSSGMATVEMTHSGPEGSGHYAIFQEFGTSKMPAHPFFRPGVAAAKPEIKTIASQALEKALAKHVD